MELGPVEYVVIDFPGNRFNGAIAPAIANLVDRGLVRILDLVFVKKDEDGTVASFEYDDLEEAAGFADIDGEADGLLSDADIEELAGVVDPDSSALFIMWEDVWAAELGKAVRDAGGKLVVGERVPHDVVAAAFAGLGTTDEEGSA